MQIIKFTINEVYYEKFKTICTEEDITIKKKLNELMLVDTAPVENIRDYYPEDFNETQRIISLKVNEEFHFDVSERAEVLGINASKYVTYLIYRFLKDEPVTS